MLLQDLWNCLSETMNESNTEQNNILLFNGSHKVNFSNFSSLKLSIFHYSEVFRWLHYYWGASHKAAKIKKINYPGSSPAKAGEKLLSSFIFRAGRGLADGKLQNFFLHCSFTKVKLHSLWSHLPSPGSKVSPPEGEAMPSRFPLPWHLGVAIDSFAISTPPMFISRSVDSIAISSSWEKAKGKLCFCGISRYSGCLKY